MNKLKLWLAMSLVVAANARAGLVIDSLGVTSVYDASGYGAGYTVSSVTLTFDISGGYNGNLYAYLSFNGQMLNLFNNPGGLGVNTDPGFAATLSDAGVAGIQNYPGSSPQYNGNGQLTGTWQANNGTVTFFSTFGGLDPNGEWTFFVRDTAGGSSSTLNSWSLNITAVPEPVNVALGVFAGVLVITGLVRRVSRKNHMSEV